MEKLPMCRICLVQNVRMFVVVNRNLRELYEKLTDIPFVTEDRRPMVACFFCCAKLKQCYRLLRQCLKAEELFAQKINEDYELKPFINQDHLEFYSGFIKSPIVHISIVGEGETESIAIKEELPAVCEGLDDAIESKEEYQSEELELENSDNSCLDVADIPPQCSESDSEDDVPLIDFQTEVDEEQEVYKKKRKARDTKNPFKMQANLNMEMRANIIALRKSGLNITQISNETGVNRKTVVLWVRRFEEEGSLENHQRTGRPRLINTLQRQTMIREYEENGFLPTNHYAGLFDTSVDTVRRALHSEGLHYRRPAVKPLLTETDKKARLQFALNHINFDWSNVIFTDEKTFKSSDQGRLCLWRRNNTRYRSGIVVPNMQSGHITVNMWGWMSAADPGELVRLPSQANSANYIEVLEETMLPTVRNVYPRAELPQIKFVQDNCPIHRSHSVQAWFRQHNDICVIPWPARSPDLNPIENLWGVIIQRWNNKNERTPDALEAHCLQIWESIRGSDLCKNLISSMRSRMQAVIDQNGGYTNY